MHPANLLAGISWAVSQNFNPLVVAKRRNVLLANAAAMLLARFAVVGASLENERRKEKPATVGRSLEAVSLSLFTCSMNPPPAGKFHLEKAGLKGRQKEVWTAYNAGRGGEF